MRNVNRAALLAALLCAAVPAIAPAATVNHSGGHVTFTAAPGEVNWVALGATTACESLQAPCLKVGDSPGYTLVAQGGCIAPSSQTFPTVLCPLPTSVSVDAGDMDDRVYDWDEASSVAGGPGVDILDGAGGHDILDGGDGVDTVIGGPGNDQVKGGPGNDILEANLWPITALPRESEGADRIEGGPDIDTVSYRGRIDGLFFTVDDLANDGAPAEGDLVARDVEVIEGGAMGDTLTGDAGHNALYGGGGPDTIRGGSGDDSVDGGVGADSVSGEDGADKVFGGGDDDIVDGGSGADEIYGEKQLGCSGFMEPCVGGSDDIRARDGARDLVDCGDGTDRVAADTTDFIRDIPGSTVCESLDRQAVSAPAVGGAPPATPASSETACLKLAPAKIAACVRLARAIARCGTHKPATRKAACVRKARAVARCRSLRAPAARARCMKSLSKSRRS
jgi:RTX calcium-binding nonapeptide repeat (4 copies)